jgi:thiol:disulfide interchange protein DsbD
MQKIMSFLILLLLCLSCLLAAQGTDVLVQSKANPSQIAPGGKGKVEFRLSIAPEWHLYAYNNSGDFIRLAITPVATPDFVFGQPVYPAPIAKELFGEKLMLYEGDILVSFEIQVRLETKAGKHKLQFTVEYQGCTDNICAAPVTQTENVSVTVVGEPQQTAPITQQEPATPTPQQPSQPGPGDSWGDLQQEPATPTPQQPSQPGPGDSWGDLLWRLLGVFIGGIATSFTPCVYPMIPLTVSFFANQSQSKSKKQIFGLALVFVLGIATFCTVLGVATALFKANFNVLLQSAWVLGGLAAIFMLLGLSFFGLFALRLPDFITSRARVKSKGAAGAFGRGLFLGIVAAPCMGPVIVAVLSLVPDQPILGGIFLFVYAWGVGVPFIALALFSGLLPRGGTWLYGFEITLGCILIALGLFFLEMVVSLKVMAIVSGLLLLAFGLFLLRGFFREGSKSVTRMVTAAVSLLLAIALLPGFLVQYKNRPLPEYLMAKAFFYDEEGWEKDYDKGRLLARKEKKPVLVDVWAKWCTACRWMDNTVMKDERVVAELRRFVKIKLDVTLHDEKKNAILKKHRVLGPPWFIFYDSQGNLLADKTIQGKSGTESFLAALQNVR